MTKKADTKIVLDQEGIVQFVLDKDSLEVSVRVEGQGFEKQIDKTTMRDLKPLVEKIGKLKPKITKAKIVNNWWDFGDTVFLYWPTGTGKTHTVCEWIKSKGIEYDVVTVSDGFEDIDFLTHIVPTAKGITYKEKKILSLLRQAASGEKVAILVDEVNRGSKSFMNMLLKMTDSVNGVYEINNFVCDEVIVIPRENIIWFCTANLGWGYAGTNDLDEALLDRFNKVEFAGYNPVFEWSLISNFGEHADGVKTIVEYIRDLFKDNAVKRPISSRWLKTWTEDFVNTDKKKQDVFGSFDRTVLYRLVDVDAYGFPNEDDMGILVSKFNELWFISSSKAKDVAKWK